MNQGFCVDYQNSIIGRPCDLRLVEGMKTVKGVDDLLYCGLVKYNEDNSARVVEWEGSCQQGVCRICTGWIFPFAPFSGCPDGRVCMGGEYIQTVLELSVYNSLMVWMLLACVATAISVTFCGVALRYSGKMFDYLFQEVL